MDPSDRRRPIAWRHGLIAVLAAMALIAGACGGDDDEPGAASPSASEPTGTEEPAEPADTEEPADAAEEPAAQETPTEVPATPEPEAPATRIVEHGLGTTEVPGRAERIVVMDPGTILPTLLFLGQPVVAAPLPAEPFPSRLVSEEDLSAITSVGLPDVSFELIAASEPDLIIGFDLSLADTYDQLSQIAPTVAVELDLNDWRGNAERIGIAVGIEDEMAAALADYDARVAQLQTDLGDTLDTEVSVVRALGQLIRLHTRFHFAGQVLDDVGFARPEAQRTDDPEVRLVQISLEELPQADGDVMFVFGAGSLGSLGGDEVSEVVQAILDHPLYPTLAVAQSDAVFVVDPLGWQQGGLPAANLILDDLEEAFLS
ncbi:MAG: iron-siderophore ABC transporter substrate-binding protein [Actinomycetota bacterium]